MRLSEWRATAPVRDIMAPKVLAVVEPVLASLGAEPDPHVWIAWGDDPGVRYAILAPTPAGLGMCAVRVNAPGEGPRASGKLVRWAHVQVGELAVETSAGHRLVSIQVESVVLRGTDAVADAIAAFVLRLLAAMDGRPMPDLGATPAAPARAGAGSRARKQA